MTSNKRMKLTGRGRRFTSGWHHQAVYGGIVARAASLQPMRRR
jgi:hypothetical protein